MSRKKREIRILSQGLESSKNVELLLGLTSIRSESIRTALHDYLVKGTPEESVSVLNGVNASNFRKALATLDAAAVIVETIVESRIK